MHRYRCYLMDGIGRSSDLRSFDARNDEEAIALSTGWFMERSTAHDRIEVWRAFDLIYVDERMSEKYA